MFLKWRPIKGNNYQKRVLILVLALVMSVEAFNVPSSINVTVELIQ